MTRRILGSLVVAALAVGGCSLPGNVTGSREVSAVFDDVGDLVSGHSVQVADVRVGSISSIELTEDFRARVTMSLKDGVFIPRQSRAILRTTSLLGEKFIEIRPVDDDPMAGDDLVDGDVLSEVGQAPELEFVAEQAVEILGSVVAADVQTLVETGATGFGGRAPELRTIVDNLAVISGTLADQSDNLVRIVTALDGATTALAGSATDIGQLLEDLAQTTTILADNREVALEAVRQLTRLARIQNETVFGPYLAEVNQQVRHLDAILAAVASNQTQVADLLYWLSQFADLVPRGAPNGFAQVYGLLAPVES